MSNENNDFLSDLRAIYQDARDEDIQELGPYIAATMTRYDIVSPLRQCHFLAQIGHESGQLRYREEIASGSDYENRQDLGNVKPGDGRKFKGRGLIQLTGRSNYLHYDVDRQLNGQLMAHPERLAESPELCCDVAGWFWTGRHLNTLADSDDISAITKKINGGFNGLKERKWLLIRAKMVLLDRTAGDADDITRLQRFLNTQGATPPLKVDGDMGPRTHRALEAFRRLGGSLPADLEAIF